MIKKLKQAFTLASWHYRSHKHFMRSFRNVTDATLKKTDHVMVYSALQRLKNHMLSDIFSSCSYGGLIKPKSQVNESLFPKEVALAKRLCDAHNFSEALTAHVQACAAQTASWVIQTCPDWEKPRPISDLTTILQKMLHVQAKAFAFDGLKFKAPPIKFQDNPDYEALGWVLPADITDAIYTVPDINIRKSALTQKQNDNVFKAVFHEGLHVLLGQMARHYSQGRLPQNSALHSDGQHLKTKRALRYTSSLYIKSLYYSDPEEKLVHAGHRHFMACIKPDQAKSASMAIPQKSLFYM